MGHSGDRGLLDRFDGACSSGDSRSSECEVHESEQGGSPSEYPSRHAEAQLACNERNPALESSPEYERNSLPYLTTKLGTVDIDTPSHRQSPSTAKLFQNAEIDLSEIVGIRIIRELGRGGMGVVYEGWDTELGRQVAVKLLSPHLVGDPAAVERFLREAQAAAQLQHENIVAIYSVQQIERTPVLVQQYVPGVSLRERMQREKKIPFSSLSSLALHVARGLAVAHARGVIHRDLKPDNILLDREANLARIADFGLAKLSGVTVMTQHGILAGTPAFMSPEQASGKPLDGRSDLFSLGVVLYAAASDSLPFVADEACVLLDKIQHQEVAPLASLRPDLPDWFCEIVTRLMAKRKEDRIASARELVSLIEREVAPPPLRTKRSRTRTAFVLSTALVLGLGGLGGLGWYALGAWGKFHRLEGGNSSNPGSVAHTYDRPGFDASRTPAGDFSVAGSRFSSLVEAVEAASDGSTILVSGPGPHLVDTIAIEGKRLTIEATPGVVAEFRPSVPGKDAPSQFLSSNSDLTLKGLRIDWPVELPPLFANASPSQAVISSSGGRLTIDQCSICCGRGGICVGAGGCDLVLSRAILDSGEICVAWSTKDDVVKVDNCLLQGRAAFVMVPPDASSEFPRSPKMNLHHTTLIVSDAFDFVLYLQPMRPVEIDLRECVLDGKSLVRLIGMPALKRNIYESEAMANMLREVVEWSEQRCIHKRGASFLSSRRPRQLKNPCKSDLVSLNQWLEFWQQPSSNSIEADLFAKSIGVRLGDVLHEFHLPSGSTLIECGANAKELGPAPQFGSSDAVATDSR